MQNQTGPAPAGSLAAMILRAEAACEFYRLRAEEKGHPPPVIHKRYEMLWSMQAVLRRLQAQRVAR